MATTSSTKTPHFDSLHQRAFLNLWRTYDRLRQAEETLFAPYQLSAQQYNVLRLLKAERPVGLPTLALARRLISRAPDITRMLDLLDRQGRVERRRHEQDRRRVQVVITARGVALLEELSEPLRRCHRQQLGHLSAEELRSLVRLLTAARAPHEPPGSPWRGR